MSSPDRGHGGERGSASLQMVVLMPALFLVLFLGVQGALYYYAGTVAGAAAQDGARAAAAYHNHADPGVGRDAALAALAQSHGSLTGYRVTASRSAGGATVTVTGQSLSVLPGLVFTVSRSATLPWEELT